ncbi:uncharacterized protein LOC144555071 isoform X1 [Carex rostrata]
MAETSPSPTLPTTIPPLVLNKEHFQQMGERIEELDGSQAELLSRIQGLKEEVQRWRLNLDKQVKTYKTELDELKRELNSDVDQLKSEVKEVKTTLHSRQNSWAFNLWNFGMKDASENGNQELGYDTVTETIADTKPSYALERKKHDQISGSPNPP